jgi:hypothetical protein
MAKEEDPSKEKAAEILRTIREESAGKKHLDPSKIKARAALRRAIEMHDEDAFSRALGDLGIDPESEVGKKHLQGFRQLWGR